jgi:phosphoribosylformylglycinamidine synthase subunit PurQ / glutaminase
MRPRTLILRAAGTNCDAETAFAFRRAGAETESVHINRILENPSLLDTFQIMALPGGFSYGDDIAAGKILANQLAGHLGEQLRKFVDAGKPVIGICNGFQVLVKTDLLPGSLGGRTGQTCTLTNNDCGRLIDRWVSLRTVKSKCVWTRGLTNLELPIAHGEGKFVPADDAVRKDLWERGQVALVYEQENPNGSVDAIAGVCDQSGLVFGLMPHPERHLETLQHPAWSSRKNNRESGEGDGLQVFRNAVNHVSQ